MLHVLNALIFAQSQGNSMNARPSCLMLKHLSRDLVPLNAIEQKYMIVIVYFKLHWKRSFNIKISGF